jgi:hypothetical protein
MKLNVIRSITRIDTRATQKNYQMQIEPLFDLIHERIDHGHN